MAKKVTFQERNKNYRDENRRLDAVVTRMEDDNDEEDICERISKMLVRSNLEFPELNSPESDSDEYDIELDECLDGFKETKNTKNCRDIYLQACHDLNIVPASLFSRKCITSSIDLKHYGIGDKGARAVGMAMKHNQTVRELNLHDNGIGEKGVVAICDMMAVNMWISDLDISGNDVGKTGLAALANTIQNAVMLKRLNLSQCKIQGSGVKEFISSLSHNHRLQTLDLSYNEIGDEGVACFEGVLTKNTTLKSLDISFNSISFLGMEDFCNGLIETESLEELNLAWNGLGDDGASSIGTVLSYNTSLKVLDVSHNHISKAGIEHIADSLEHNFTLEVLKVGKNPFLAYGASLILESLQEYTECSLRELVLDGIAFNKDCEDKLAALKKIQPKFVCKWDGSIRGGAVIVGEFALPTELYLTALYSQGFRLLDFYRYLSSDSKDGLLTKQNFITGSKKRNFPFGEKELGKLFDFLDAKQNGIISYEEFMTIKKDIQQAKRQERRKSMAGSPQRFVQT